MRSILKFVLVVGGLLVGLVLLAVMAIYFLFDVNQYRDEIAEALSEETGREVRLDGQLSLSVFPRLAITTEDVTIGNAPAFGPEPMLKLQRVAAGIDFMPLTRGELSIQTIEVIGLTVNLAVRGDGMNNWSDLVEAGEASSDADDSAVVDSGSGDDSDVVVDGDATEIDVSFGGLIVRDASVTYVDGSSETTYRLEDLDLELRGDDLTQPLDLTMAFVASADPGALRVQAAFDTSIQMAGADETLRFVDLDLTGSVSSEELPSPAPFALESDSIVLDFANNTLNVAPTRIDLLELSMLLVASGSGPAAPLDLSGRIEVESFEPAKLLPRLGIDAPVTADPEALRAVSFQSEFDATFESAGLRDLTLVVDDTELSGELSIVNFANMGLRFDLTGDSMILDRYLPPAEDEAVADDAGDALAETALPVDLLKGMEAAGRLRFGRLVLGDLPFESLDLGLTVKDSKAQLQPVRATVLEGRYEGDVRIDASRAVPRLSLNERIDDLNLGAMASLLFDQDNVEGRLNGSFTLAGQGVTLADIRSSLNGDVAIVLADGALRGTDLWYEIRRARALFKQSPPPPAPAEARTEFSSISGTAVVRDGVATNNDLFAELPFLQLTGNGSVNLGEGSIDYDLDARVLERPDFLSGATAEELDEYTEAVIPLEVTGEMTAPTIRPDFQRLARDAVERKLDEEKDRLRNRLLDRLGIGEDATEEDGEEAEEEEDIEDALKKRLRDIF
ncbi:MAG: AsmA family protein [Pseudomonadota bacterium]